MKNKRLLIKISILVVILLGVLLALSGCIRGMTPIGWSGVAVSNGTLYTGSKEGRLVSVDLNSNNARKWAEPIKLPSTGGAGCSSIGGGACGAPPPVVAIYGTPVLSNVPVLGNLVFLAGYNGKVYAYTADTLQQRWVYPPEGNLRPIISSVVISGSTLYFGGTDGNVYALDIATGAEKWKFSTGGEIWSTPVIDNGLLFISSFDKKVYAIDAATGTKKWEYTTGATNVAPPVVAGGTVYVGSLDRNLHALNIADGSLKWKFGGNNFFWSKPIALSNVIYAPNLDRNVYGLNAGTGEKLVSYDVGGQVASWPVVINNRVIVATRDGKVWSLDTNPANFSNSDNKKLITSLPAGIDVTAPLSASGDSVYINGSDNNIYIVNITSGSISSPISLKSQ